MQIADDGLPHEFTHPLLGRWNARIRSLAISHQSSARNFVAVKIEIIEDGIDSFLPEIIPSMEQLQTDLDADLEELDQQRVAYGIGTLATAITRIQELKKNIESQIYDVQRKVDTVRKALDDSMDHARKLTTPKQWPVVRACRRTARNCMKLAERVQQKKPIVRGEETNVQAPISVIAHARYGDSNRAEELIAINNLKNPFLIPPGTQLKVYAD
jgi:prophage DNA circulation protein